MVTSHLQILASSLRMVTCYYEGHAITYGLLRAIYGKINPWKIVRSFDMSKNLPLFSRILTSAYELMRVMTSYLRILESYLQILAIDYELVICKDSYEKSVYVKKV